MKITGLILALSLTLAARAHAQFPDLIDLSGQYLPAVPVDIAPAKAQVTVYDASLNIPVVLGERSFLIPGASYHADSMTYSDAPPQFDQISLLQSADLAALFVQLLPADWSISARVSAGLAGDIITFDREHMRFSGLIMATHVFSEHLVLGGGALANYAFGTLLPLPAIYLDYKPLPELRFETFLPAFANIRYTIAERVELGLRAEVTGNAYSIRSAQVRDDWPCVALPEDDAALPGRQDRAEPSRCMDHIAYSIISAGVHVGVRLFATLWVTAFAGRTLYRRLEPMTNRDNAIDSELQTLPNAWTLRAHLTWRLPRK